MLEKKSSPSAPKRSDPFVRAGGGQGVQNQRLKNRRRRAYRLFLYALALLMVSGIGGVWYGLWQPSVRISMVQVFGADPSLAQEAREALAGTYLHLLPRNSIFFIPESAIRSRILDAHPEIVALSIFREGFTGISIKVDPRVPVARWCGVAKPTSSIPQQCYLFDANGLVYAAATTASSTALNTFAVYDSLVGEGPIRATLERAAQLPAVFDLARRIGVLGGVVATITIRGDEVDDVLQSGTRITYVIGDEENAFAALVSAKNDFNLADGSISYLDLRFDGKIYLKRTATTTASHL